MKKLEIIREMLSLVEILPEERVVLIKGLISEWNLTQDECFPKIPKKRGRKPKVKGEAEVGVKNSSTAQPKHRGRKPKVKNDVTEVVDDKKIEEQPKRRRGRPRKNVVEEASGVVKTSVGKSQDKPKALFVSFVDYPVLKKQVIGGEQEFSLLYKYEGRLLLSNYILTEMVPIGIYIPYRAVMFGKYKGFILYLYDEVVYQNIGEAIRDARAKDDIGGEYWSVMDSLQLVTINPLMEQVNRILKKVGGDEFRGLYATITPGSTCAVGKNGKIRYTINVK